ncbi:alpha/beta fold hydrolase [Gordonia sp. SL306]|uniref:alpha/beta fold hydrolase n=1 Tax=Gordonia sp. SL306 TaxID=2995145 RepID=UPI00227215C6|nr:alpha/beta hydrolase [Gordonia sp. SL306]WAC56811.1 alpha/beta hydrolase [Gordonia sp. SL306]
MTVGVELVGDIVLIPGMMCDDQLWEDMEPHLPEGARVHHAALRGDSISAVAENILAEAPLRFTVVGLSLGGIVAMHLAVCAPERIAGMVVLSSNARAPRPDQFRGWRESKMRLANGASSGAEQQRILGSLVSAKSISADPTLIDRVVGMAERIGSASTMAQLAAQESRRDYLDDLAGITCPALIVAGGEDPLCPGRVMRNIAERLPNSAFELVVDSGHLTPMEHPRVTGEIIAEWFDSHIRTSGCIERESSRL